VDVLVSASSIFGSEDYRGQIEAIRGAGTTASTPQGA
jgi:pentose-5-phosphate-3-epimerase